jgi:lipopolysaccharide biosynthesis glycosyltransferase
VRKNRAICIVTDKKYFPYSLVLIHRLKDLLRDADLYVVSDDRTLEKPTIEFLKTIEMRGSFKFWNNGIRWKEIYGLEQSLHVSTVAFAVADLPNLLSTYNQIFSVAVDVLPGDDFIELLQTKMPFAISAVPDIDTTQLEKKGVVDDSYFNTGVVIYDREIWNSHRMSESISRVLEKRNPLKYQEQDLLNLVANGHYGRLGRKWNQIAGEGTLDFSGNIHFAGSEKPWTINSRRTGSEMWVQTASELIEKVLNAKRYKVNNAFYEGSLKSSNVVLNPLIRIVMRNPHLKRRFLDLTFVESIKELEKILENKMEKYDRISE